ncbi:hypothetical protein GDN83_08485 [Gordonia jinghuaiqii]|uniref:Uncharacterized protein n=1 Tax=Gordonia jinghuaiqii TaxID=2758710 RepID=A0A7D7LZ65_9ACTN|nr:hypothetical protein [Gordonia jinghuaiqii]MCR5977776.1 hypothetical protein [Gordonia jinghuaiqii]QMT02436.1 hypothetical protein H1R19_04560 [Gordonia jinghuaiqii]
MSRDHALARFEQLSQLLLATRREGLTRTLTPSEVSHVDRWEKERAQLREQFPDVAFGREQPKRTIRIRDANAEPPRPTSAVKTRPAKPKAKVSQRSDGSKKESEAHSAATTKATKEYRARLLEEVHREIKLLQTANIRTGLTAGQQSRLRKLKSLKRQLESTPAKKAKPKKFVVDNTPSRKTSSSGGGRIGLIKVARGGLRQTRGR